RQLERRRARIDVVIGRADSHFHSPCVPEIDGANGAARLDLLRRRTVRAGQLGVDRERQATGGGYPVDGVHGLVIALRLVHGHDHGQPRDQGHDGARRLSDRRHRRQHAETYDICAHIGYSLARTTRATAFSCSTTSCPTVLSRISCIGSTYMLMRIVLSPVRTVSVPMEKNASSPRPETSRL